MGSVSRLCTLLDLWVSSVRRGHANLLCHVPVLTDDPRRESWDLNPDTVGSRIHLVPWQDLILRSPIGLLLSLKNYIMVGVAVENLPSRVKKLNDSRDRGSNGATESRHTGALA